MTILACLFRNFSKDFQLLFRFKIKGQENKMTEDAGWKTAPKEEQYSDLHSFEETEWRKWKMIETNGECRWKKSEKESRCWEGKGGDLPHAVCVQKWRVDEAQVVVCYHGNIGEQGRGKQETPSISRANHYPKCLLFRCDCGGVFTC